MFTAGWKQSNSTKQCFSSVEFSMFCFSNGALSLSYYSHKLFQFLTDSELCNNFRVNPV